MKISIALLYRRRHIRQVSEQAVAQVLDARLDEFQVALEVQGNPGRVVNGDLLGLLVHRHALGVVVFAVGFVAQGIELRIAVADAVFRVVFLAVYLFTGVQQDGQIVLRVGVIRAPTQMGKGHGFGRTLLQKVGPGHRLRLHLDIEVFL